MCDYCSWVDQLLTRFKGQVKEEEERKKRARRDPVIIVHAEAGTFPKKLRKSTLRKVREVAIGRYKELLRGASSVETVEKAVALMETERNSNRANGVVGDAAIACGKKAGCVAAVSHVKHPIALARRVMENTKHVLVVEEGARRLAIETTDVTATCPVENHGQEGQRSDECLSYDDDSECPSGCSGEQSDEEPCQLCHVPDADQESLLQTELFQMSSVGACALDRKGRLSSGVSATSKTNGPISAAAAIIGCGVSANENSCVSVSGEDRSIYLYAPARRINRKIGQQGTTVIQAVSGELDNFEAETGQSRIGAVALNRKGESAIRFKSREFPWAICERGVVHYGSSIDEKFSETIKTDRPLDCMCGVSD